MKAEQHFEVILHQKMHLFCNFPATMQLPQLLMHQQCLCQAAQQHRLSRTLLPLG